VPWSGVVIDIDEAAGLFDDSVSRCKSKSRPFPTSFVEKNGSKILSTIFRRNASAGVADFDQDIVGRGHAFILRTFGLFRRNIHCLDRKLTTIGHGVPRIHRQINDHLFELRKIGLHRPQIAAMNDVGFSTFSPSNRFSSTLRSDSTSPTSSTCGRNVCLRGKCEQLPNQCRSARRVLLNLDDVLERRIGRLVRVEQKIIRHHDGREDVVEIVRDAAASWPTGLHLLRLREMILQRALFGRLEKINDGRFGVARILFDRGDKN